MLPNSYTPRKEWTEILPESGFSVCIVGRHLDFSIISGPKKSLKECLEFVPYANCAEYVIIHHHKHYSEILYERDFDRISSYKLAWKLRKITKIGRNYLPKGKYTFYKLVSKEKYLEERLKGNQCAD